MLIDWAGRQTDQNECDNHYKMSKCRTSVQNWSVVLFVQECGGEM